LLRQRKCQFGFFVCKKQHFEFEPKTPLTECKKKCKIIKYETDPRNSCAKLIICLTINAKIGMVVHKFQINSSAI